MTTRPILFSGPMVRAILDGRKTQTRRILKPQPPQDWKPLPYLGELHRMEDGEPVEPRTKRDIIGPGWTEEDGLRGFRSPYAPGDRLWVREAWRIHAEYDALSPSEIPTGVDVQFAADDPLSPWDSRARPSIHMPRWASRITLIVTDVRAERVQEISEEDAFAEGAQCQIEWCEGIPCGLGSAIPSFIDLWNSIHGPDAWDRNDWVAAITFEKESADADA